MVYDTYKSSIDATMRESDRLSADTSGLSEAKGNDSLIAAILEKLSETASDLADRAAKLLNRYIEALAILIVTSCIIPLLALAFFLWLIRLLTGANVFGALSSRPLDFRSWSRGRSAGERENGDPSV